MFFWQSIIQKKTTIRRKRREIFLQDQKQKHAQAAEQARQQERESQPLKQVENYTHTSSITQAHQPTHSSPVKSPVHRSEGVTVAFGRTTKIQHQRSPSAGKSMVRRHSLENDSVSTVQLSSQLLLFPQPSSLLIIMLYTFKSQKICFLSLQVMSPPRQNPAGRARPISAQVKPKNTIITRSNSADKLLQVTSARLVSFQLI